ncbi:hypothetical protein SLE2022_325370 [Rubroshorea leprosula]
MEEDSNRAEALRLLGIAEKLLQNRDFNASRDFAILAQETEPLLDGSDQIVAVADVLLAAEKRVNNHHDWYAILQIDRRSDDHDLIKKQYRRLALLLHPDKNKFAFADQAFKLVADAWAVLSNNSKKTLYDKELTLFTKVDLSSSNSKLPVRRAETMNQTRNVKKSADVNNKNSSSGDPRSRLSTFWTACPYCYRLFEYPRVYIGCCLKCQNCNRAFHAVLIQNLPPMVPGKEAYYCCWSLFPLGFVMGNPDDDRKAAPGAGAGFPNWMPPVFSAGQQQGGKNASVAAPATISKGAERRNKAAPVVHISDRTATNSAPRKRGRPRKNPL